MSHHKTSHYRVLATSDDLHQIGNKPAALDRTNPSLGSLDA